MLLIFAPLAGVRIGLADIVPVIAAMFLISFTLTGLGFVQSHGRWILPPHFTAS